MFNIQSRIGFEASSGEGLEKEIRKGFQRGNLRRKRKGKPASFLSTPIPLSSVVPPLTNSSLLTHLLNKTTPPTGANGTTSSPHLPPQKKKKERQKRISLLSLPLVRK